MRAKRKASKRSALRRSSHHTKWGWWYEEPGGIWFTTQLSATKVGNIGWSTLLAAARRAGRIP